MWCKNCRQDTPGIRSPRQPGMRCSRCGVALVTEAAAPRSGEFEHPAEVGLDLQSGPAASASSFEDWELDQNLRSLEARFGPWRKRHAAHAEQASRQPQWRFDAPHMTAPQPQMTRRRRRTDRPARRSSILAHGVVWLGLVTLAAGGGLLGWSMFESRPDLWTLGLPIAAGGGGVFLVGLVWQLERIWRNSRFAVQKLRQLDSQLRQLEHTTSMLSVTHGSASQAFYSHMADGANPHMLLADLKGQIDLLAMNFARR
jgi:hypothetical protein